LHKGENSQGEVGRENKLFNTEHGPRTESVCPFQINKGGTELIGPTKRRGGVLS